jgi:hypothetical protein
VVSPLTVVPGTEALAVPQEENAPQEFGFSSYVTYASTGHPVPAGTPALKCRYKPYFNPFDAAAPAYASTYNAGFISSSSTFAVSKMRIVSTTPQLVEKPFPHQLACGVYTGTTLRSAPQDVFFNVRPIDSLPSVKARVSWVVELSPLQKKAAVPFLSTLLVLATGTNKNIVTYASRAGSPFVAASVETGAGDDYYNVADVAGCTNGATDSTFWEQDYEDVAQTIPKTAIHVVRCTVWNDNFEAGTVVFSIVVEPYKQTVTPFKPSPAAFEENVNDKAAPILRSHNAIIDEILSTSSNAEVNTAPSYIAEQITIGTKPGQVTSTCQFNDIKGARILDMPAPLPELFSKLYAYDDVALWGPEAGKNPIVCLNVLGGAVDFNHACLLPGSNVVTCKVWDLTGNSNSVKFTIPVIAAAPDQTCPNGCVNGDPQFTGFLGQSYQVHGVSGQSYNVLSTPKFQYNALFSYLDSGRCRAGTMCFSHPGNYFGQVGFLLRSAAGQVSRLQVIAGAVDAGLQVLLNDQPLAVSSTPVVVGETTLVFSSAFDFYVTSPEFSMKLSNSDMFINQDVTINSDLLSAIQNYKQLTKSGQTESAAAQLAALPHGLLGQTWQYKTYDNRWKYIEGSLFEYSLADGVMGVDFKYNRF